MSATRGHRDSGFVISAEHIYTSPSARMLWAWFALRIDCAISQWLSLTGHWRPIAVIPNIFIDTSTEYWTQNSWQRKTCGTSPMTAGVPSRCNLGFWLEPFKSGANRSYLCGGRRHSEPGIVIRLTSNRIPPHRSDGRAAADPQRRQRTKAMGQVKPHIAGAGGLQIGR